jgi:hypothetical protein
MHYAAKFPFNLPRLDAFTASLRDWLLALGAWLLENFGERVLPNALRRELRAELISAAYDIKRALLIYALKDARPRRPERHRAKPFAGPPGFRLAQPRASTLRYVTRGVFRGLNTGSLAQRIARLRDLLARRDLWVARLKRRFARGFVGARLTRIAPPARTLTSEAQIAPAACADTS